MPTSFGEPLTKLRAVPIRENHEPLVDPRSLSQRIGFMEKHPRFPDMHRDSRVRKSVAEMLAKAADSLPDHLQLTIIQGFRPLAAQRMMYNTLRDEYRQKHPEWSASTLNRVTNTFSAPPDDKCPPPHSTGGAVDLAFIELVSGDFFDVTSPLGFDETSAPTKVKGLSETAKKNREFLVETLEKTGLTNYAGEWWHWSYGDSGWALRTGAKFALYDRLEEAGK